MSMCRVFSCVVGRGCLLWPMHFLGAVKVLHSVCQQFGKFSRGHRTGKGQFSFQSQRKTMPKNAQTTEQLHSSHASKVMLKILQARLQQYVNHELPGVQAGFRKGRGTRDQIANIRWIMEKSKQVPEKHLFLLYWLCQTFDCVDHNNCW